MMICFDTKPTLEDGLSDLQRAIIRLLIASPSHIKCTRLAAQLLAAPGCPSDLSVHELDGVLLAMSCPQVCSQPLIGYIGVSGFEDGWIPGPQFRAVHASQTTFGILRADDKEDYWSPKPLDVRCAAALAVGCASWEMYVDDDYADDYWDQAGRRLRCRAVHCLGVGYIGVLRAKELINKTGTLARCLVHVGPEADVLCCGDPKLVRPLAERRGSLDASGISFMREDLFLPHGIAIGYHCLMNGEANSGQVQIDSVPRLRMVPGSVLSQPAIVVDQAACGQHPGDALAALLKTPDLESLPETEGFAPGGPPFTLLSKGSFDVSYDELRACVPFEPLGQSSYEQMLGG